MLCENNKKKLPVRRMCRAAIAIGMSIVMVLSGCSGIGSDNSASNESETSNTTSIGGSNIQLTPAAGTPLACECGSNCKDATCVKSQEAYAMKLYPWMARSLIKGVDNDGNTPLYQEYVKLRSPKYEDIATDIADKKSVAFSSAFLDSLYNGPSNLAAQHLYELVIMEWLKNDNDDSTDSDTAKKANQAASLAFKAWSAAANDQAEVSKSYENAVALWQGLTGEALDSSVASTLGMADKFRDAVGKLETADKAANGAKYGVDFGIDIVEAWSNVNSVCNASYDKISLLERASRESDNEDFRNAANRVIDAYKQAINDGAAFDQNTTALAAGQYKAAAFDAVCTLAWDKLADANPIISSFMSISDLVLNVSKVADMNMTILGVYTVGAELHNYGLRSSVNVITDESNANGYQAADSAEFVRDFRAYLSYEIYGIQQAKIWANSGGVQKKIQSKKIKELVDSAKRQEETRQQVLSNLTRYENLFWRLETKALSGKCTCDVCGDSTSSEAQSSTTSVSSSDDDSGSGSGTTTVSSTTDREIAMVLDVSGSMAGEPLEATKDAAEQFVSVALQNNAETALVAFDDEASVLSKFSSKESYLKSAIAQLTDAGGTNIEDGLAKADGLLDGKSDDSKKYVVLMSDGDPNDGKTGDDLISYTQSIRDPDGDGRDDVIIYALGFNESSSGELLLRKIASEGCYYSVQETSDLQDFFQDMVDSINGVKFMYARVACPVDVSVTLNGETLSSAGDNPSTRTSFGSLTFEQNDDVDDGEGTASGYTTNDNLVKVLRLREGESYDVSIVGTGEGSMDYSLGLVDDDGVYSDFRTFSDIGITDQTSIETTAEASATTTLKVDSDSDGKIDAAYRAGANEEGQLVDNSWIAYIVVIAIFAVVLVTLLAIVLIKLARRRKGSVAGR